MRRSTKSLVELPPHLKNKIRLEPETSGERHACWIWTGSFIKARQRFARHKGPEHRDAGYTDKVGTFTMDRGTPNVRCPELGYSVPAHRVLFAECHEISVNDVPRLQRCATDRCVSPWHAREIGAVIQRRAVAGEAVAAPLDGYTHERCMALLKAVDGGEGVDGSISRESAADEAGIPPDQLTEATWFTYRQWDAERSSSD